MAIALLLCSGCESLNKSFGPGATLNQAMTPIGLGKPVDANAPIGAPLAKTLAPTAPSFVCSPDQPPASEQTWDVKPGTTFKSTVASWVIIAGWQPADDGTHWDWPVKVPARFVGSIEQALCGLQAGFAQARPAPIIEIYPANRAIVIRTRDGRRGG